MLSLICTHGYLIEKEKNHGAFLVELNSQSTTFNHRMPSIQHTQHLRRYADTTQILKFLNKNKLYDKILKKKY